METSDFSNKLAFLYKVIDDNQGNIRYIDNKAAVGIAILSAMIAKLMDVLQAFPPHSSQPLYLDLLMMAVLASAICAAVLGFRVVFPTINPTKNVALDGVQRPEFYIAAMNPCRWWRRISSKATFARLSKTQSEYVEELNGATDQDLAHTLTAEVLKLSFIRELKTVRLMAFAYALVVTAALFFTALTLHTDSNSAKRCDYCTKGGASLAGTSSVDHPEVGPCSVTNVLNEATLPARRK